MKRPRLLFASMLCVPALTMTSAKAHGAADDDEASRYVEFVEDFEANCVARNAKRILVKNTHASRKLRVWLDRYHMGVGTGDRSKTDLAPGAQPEALGCSRTLDGPQQWRVVRARFVEP